MSDSVSSSAFGSVRGLGGKGRAAATLYALRSDGVVAELTDYGATLTALRLPLGGAARDVVLGLDSAEAYEGSDAYFGSTVGRFANRIAGARFSLGGTAYRLSANDGPHCLHGGASGFSRRLWRAEPGYERGDPVLRLELLSPEGDQGFPAGVSASVTYVLRGGSLVMRFYATSDAPTPFGMTNHAYFNLEGSGDVLEHELGIDASRYLPVDEGLIPLPGAPAPVDGTPFDFREPKAVGRDIEAAGGYDHCFALDGYDGTLRRAATLATSDGSLALQVWTDLPGLQCYSGNFLEGVGGKGGVSYRRHGGLCLEAEAFPDSPNRTDYPSCVLSPDRPYEATIEYRLSAKRP